MILVSVSEAYLEINGYASLSTVWLYAAVVMSYFAMIVSVNYHKASYHSAIIRKLVSINAIINLLLLFILNQLNISAALFCAIITSTAAMLVLAQLESR